MDSTSQFDKDEMDIIAQAQREQAEEDAAMLKEAQAADAAEAAGAAVQTTTAAAPVPPAAPAAAAPSAAPAAEKTDEAAAVTAAPAAAPSAGDLRPALRASRREERKLRADLERMQKELEAVKARIPAAEAEIPKPSEEVLRDVEAYAGPAAEYIKALERKTEELSKQVKQAPAPTAPPVFEPEYIPDAALQEVVDSIDELSDWQNSAQHAALWNAAKKMDDVLAVMPAWQGKSDKQRLEEVVKRVKQEFGSAPAKAPATAGDAARVIDAIPASSAPVTIGDMRGGTTPSLSTTPDYRKMIRDGMTDEEIMSSLGP